MPKMRAVDAAVAILEKEGVDTLFGLPGAAINPFYSAVRKHGGLKHILARHVEGASHMAEGYTRAKAGNIGVCVGTSGPAGTDMITGLYSASADSIPILCITGQAPVAKLHKEDFQAINIADIAKPLTKMAMTVLEAAQVPGAFQQAFHLMRSGRPGPVLLDLPFDVQQTVIDFDPDTYEPLPVYKPAATRAQAAKALDLLAAAERPLIVAGGGIINADASELLVELADQLHAGVLDGGNEVVDLRLRRNGGGERPPELDRVEAGGLGRGRALEQRQLGEQQGQVGGVARAGAHRAEPSVWEAESSVEAGVDGSGSLRASASRRVGSTPAATISSTLTAPQCTPRCSRPARAWAVAGSSITAPSCLAR